MQTDSKYLNSLKKYNILKPGIHFLGSYILHIGNLNTYTIYQERTNLACILHTVSRIPKIMWQQCIFSSNILAEFLPGATLIIA